MSSTIEIVVVLTFPMLTLGCKLAEDIKRLNFSVPSFSLSILIKTLNTARVSPAATVTIYGSEKL